MYEEYLNDLFKNAALVSIVQNILHLLLKNAYFCFQSKVWLHFAFNIGCHNSATQKDTSLCRKTLYDVEIIKIGQTVAEREREIAI